MSHEAVVLRGDDARAARVVLFGSELPAAQVMATGPWAETYNEMRVTAHAEGYGHGVAEGRRAGAAEGHAEVRSRCDSALRALDRAVEQLAAVDGATTADVAPQVVDLALELARMILGREVSSAANPGADALRRVLPLVPDRGDVVVRMNPQDIAELDGQDAALTAGRPVRFVADGELLRGDALVDVGPCRIDGRLAPAWQRVAAVLRGEEVAR